MKRSFVLSSVAVTLLAGCIGAEPTPPPQRPAASSPPEAAAPSPAAQPAAPVTPPAAEAAPAESSPDIERVRATRGVGRRGQGYGGGIITQPIATYFITRDRMLFDIQIPNQMKTFHALNDRYPKDMDEFMREIVRPTGLQMPDLPIGHRYVYDPKQVDLSKGNTGLMVERPKD